MSEDANVDSSLCPTKLIGDVVVKDDAFRHERVAAAIADMIQHEMGGRAIALTGSWGSGKSTVVGFLVKVILCAGHFWRN